MLENDIHVLTKSSQQTKVNGAIFGSVFVYVNGQIFSSLLKSCTTESMLQWVLRVHYEQTGHNADMIFKQFNIRGAD
jgi:hypothetical protein